MERRRPCKDQSRDWSDAATGSGMSTGSYQKREDAEQNLSWKLCTALLTPWFQNSGLQNRERMNLCCFEPPRLW